MDFLFIFNEVVYQRAVMSTPKSKNHVYQKYEAPWIAMTLGEAQKYLTERAFQLLPGSVRSHGIGATLYVYQNPATGQKANLSHYTNRKGQVIDSAKIVYHLLQQPKRRTPEQKARDNFILYD